MMVAAIGAVPRDAWMGVICFGEVGLDGALASAPGALPAAMAAHGMDAQASSVPRSAALRRAWASGEVVAAPSLLSLVNHFRSGGATMKPERGDLISGAGALDLRDVRGQEQAKRALKLRPPAQYPSSVGRLALANPCWRNVCWAFAAAFGRRIARSFDAAFGCRFVERGQLTRTRFRAPHHSASMMAALVGGGLRAKPGELSLAPRRAFPPMNSGIFRNKRSMRCASRWRAATFSSRAPIIT